MTVIRVHKPELMSVTDVKSGDLVWWQGVWMLVDRAVQSSTDTFFILIYEPWDLIYREVMDNDNMIEVVRRD